LVFDGKRRARQTTNKLNPRKVIYNQTHATTVGDAPALLSQQSLIHWLNKALNSLALRNPTER